MVMYKLKIWGEYMSINKCKLIGVLLLSFCIGFFINISDVKADGDNTGYAQCYYQWEEEYHPTNRPSINADSQTVTGVVYRPYVVGINYYKDGAYKMWADVACGERDSGGNAANSVAAGWTATKTGVCSIDSKNYQSVFWVADLYENKFVGSDGKWKCPDNIFIKKSNLSDDLEIYLRKDACKDGPLKKCTTVSLREDRSQQDFGIPSALDLEGRDTDKNDVAGGGSSTHVTDHNANAGSSINIQDIIAWGQKHNYDYNMGDIGEDCQVITNNQIILSILQFVIWALAIAGILILIIMTATDFVKAITASDDTGLKKAFQHLIKRAIATVILIIVPALLSFIINIINDNMPQTEGVVQLGENGDLYCGVADSN